MVSDVKMSLNFFKGWKLSLTTPEDTFTGILYSASVDGDDGGIISLRNVTPRSSPQESRTVVVFRARDVRDLVIEAPPTVRPTADMQMVDFADQMMERLKYFKKDSSYFGSEYGWSAGEAVRGRGTEQLASRTPGSNWRWAINGNVVGSAGRNNDQEVFQIHNVDNQQSGQNQRYRRRQIQQENQQMNQQGRQWNQGGQNYGQLNRGKQNFRKWNTTNGNQGDRVGQGQRGNRPRKFGHDSIWMNSPLTQEQYDAFSCDSPSFGVPKPSGNVWTFPTVPIIQTSA